MKSDQNGLTKNCFPLGILLKLNDGMARLLLQYFFGIFHNFLPNSTMTP